MLNKEISVVLKKLRKEKKLSTEYIEKYRALEVKDKAAVNAVVSTYFSNVGSTTTSSAM